MGKVPSRGVDQFVLRFPDGLRDQIREVAERNGRSMNAEIIMRLEASLAPAETIGEALTGDYQIPENTPDAAIDRAIHNAIAKALRELGVKRTEASNDE